MSAHPPLPRLGWVLLCAIALFWGGNFIAIKVSVAEIPLWQYRVLTCLAGGLGLLAVAVLSRQPLRIPTGSFRPLLLGALFNVTLWQMLSAWGLRLVPAGEAGVIAYTMPIWATLLAVIFLGERLTLRIVGALVLTALGVGVLLSRSLGVLGQSPLGAIVTLFAAICWAAGTVIQKRVRWAMPTTVVAGWQILLGGVPILVIALLTERLEVQNAGAAALWGLAYTLTLPMIFCQWAWFKVIGLFPASIAAIGTVMVPVVSIVAGAVILGEPLGWRQITAVVLVVGAIGLVLRSKAPAAALRQSDRTTPTLPSPLKGKG